MPAVSKCQCRSMAAANGRENHLFCLHNEAPCRELMASDMIGAVLDLMPYTYIESGN